jgi:hypothetical protein
VYWSAFKLDLNLQSRYTGVAEENIKTSYDVSHDLSNPFKPSLNVQKRAVFLHSQLC